LGYHREDLVASIFIVGDRCIVGGIHVLVEVRNLVEEARELKVEVSAEHLHLGDAGRAVSYFVVAVSVEHLKGGVAALYGAIEVIPFAIEVAIVGLDIKYLHAVNLIEVTNATATFVGIVGTHLTERPVGGGIAPYAPVLTFRTAQSGIGSVNEELGAV
jgi:hypothetical protein